MNNKIPKIIHQIWSDKYNPLPNFFLVLSETWKEKHHDWEYIYWDEERMCRFVQDEYPQYFTFWQSLPFDMQRWDSIRFLILYKMGGMHVDFDYECWENIESLLEHSCNIALEPETHCKQYNVHYFLNSALMACTPNHSFVKRIISQIFSDKTLNYDTSNIPLCILNTTGPLMLSHLYDELSKDEKKEIYLIPAKYVTPFDSRQIRLVKEGINSEELELCLEDAYAIHYFSNAWIPILSSKYTKK